MGGAGAESQPTEETMHRSTSVHTPGLIVLIFALVCTGTGCMSMGAGHTATPVPKGHVEVGGDVSGTISPVFQERAGSNDPEWFPVPNLGVSTRVGLAEPLDIGIRGTTTGLRGDATIALLQNSNHTLSLNPTYIWTWLPGAVPEKPCLSLSQCPSNYPRLERAHSLSANLLYDFYKSGGWTATVGTKPGVRIDEFAHTFGPGRSSAYVPMTGVTSGVRFGDEGLYYQLWGDGVGFLFTDGAESIRSVVTVKLRAAVGYRF